MDYPEGALNHALALEKLSDQRQQTELERYFELKQQIADNAVTYTGICNSEYTAIHDVLEHFAYRFNNEHVTQLVQKAVNDATVSDAELGSMFRTVINDMLIELAKD